MEFQLHAIPLDMPHSSLPPSFTVESVVLGQPNITYAVNSGCFDALTIFNRALDQLEVSQLAYVFFLASVTLHSGFLPSIAGTHITLPLHR